MFCALSEVKGMYISMKKVLLLLANGFEAVEASVFTDVIGWNKSDGDGTTDLITVGIREKLKCTFNFTVIPEIHISEVNIDEFGANVLGYERIVVDKNIITSYNPSTAFDVAFKLLEILTSKENCVHVKKLMGFN